MATVIPISAPEKGSIKIQVECKDPEDDSAIFPMTVDWTLMDIDGATINNRSGETATPAKVVEFFLSGDDLKIVDDAKPFEYRLLALEGTYNSEATGSGPTGPSGGTLPFKQEFLFQVENFQVTS